jgi:murein L,D-transpeptidase YcbB/YkuD
MRALRLASLLALASCGSEPPPAEPAPPAASAGPVVVAPEIGDFYRDRAHAPLWVRGNALRPEAHRLVRILAAAETHGLDPVAYGVPEIEGALAGAASGERSALARAELLLSRAFAEFAGDVRRIAPAARLILVDEELAPPQPDRREALDAAAAAPSLDAHLDDVERVNPVYDSLRKGLIAHRKRSAALPPERRAREEEIIRLNMERARALPVAKNGRFLFVDVAGARLWLFERGRAAEAMRVVVGKPAMATPAMAGLIRYAVLNPYWNIPPDLARERAKRVLRQGVGVLRAERIQVLSDWDEKARVVDPASIDWRAVASGRRDVPLRQLPGGDNVMGSVKFMMPNELGIYLHDTPDKSLFARADRRLSSGCVRVEDARRLSRWLFGGRDIAPSGPEPEQRVDLPEPVPVAIGYLTALPLPGGIVFQPDLYGRDAPLLAALARDRVNSRASAPQASSGSASPPAAAPRPSPGSRGSPTSG